MKKLVLIVEKQIEVSEQLHPLLESNGFEKLTAHDLESAVKIVQTYSPQIILAELDYSYVNGLDLCRQLRNEKNDWTPIILISAKDDEVDAVLGLELGADDYVIKPIKPKELVARMKSILRRGNLCCLQGGYKQENQWEKGKIFNGNLAIDPDHFMVYLEDEPVNLTRKEYEILYYLFINKGKVLTRQQLINELSAEDMMLDERIIDVFISRIRQKIEPHRKNPVYIKTVRQMGYMMKDMDVSGAAQTHT
ncbi:two-component system, OmpR family, alkaline phosphatase synthesis response regulator PhoP [Evansella caseinilytica]|uniref:Two-component system, OmpR family, alkaline phosphatase synthesis response regulator PhoP n=1 Tax=Evansella caseinilytica TaxID=1503961 RepID=A0A1H3PR36_9BACI|nr:response regulator transcription factor [Evansella caseinilytica]SDZ03506.1 two-component system, OmpR family, alkaline phosphatase synthesis response regulator PhoP [Evansella caseinilytica]